MLRRFLDEVDYATVNYVTKNTFFYERRLIEQYPNVYVIDIERDHADMLISLLFALGAERMNKATIEEVREAYWRLGPAVIGQVTRHHSVWGPPSARLHRASYERLKTMPEDAIGEIASFVGVPLSAERLAAVMHATSLKSLTEKWSGFPRRFRKGIVGDPSGISTTRSSATSGRSWRATPAIRGTTRRGRRSRSSVNGPAIATASFPTKTKSAARC